MTSGATVNASFIAGLTNPTVVAAFGSDLYVANFSGNTVSEYTTTGASVNASLITGLDGASGVAISGSDLFVVSYGNGSTSDSGTVGEYTTSVPR